tara:strand:- start:2477 stop:3829 length:1353 start_codon:yes stop_codon:yes gene_type:complete
MSWMDFAAGMAEEGADILEEKRKYIREKRQSNRDWLDTYGKKIVAERQESVNSVLNMSNYIIGRGVERTFVDYLYDQGGVPAISNMYNSIKDDTSITGREAQAFVGDIGTYTSPDTPLADRIKEGFGMYTRAETPDRQEENNFFSGLGLLFGDETEYADRDLDQLAVDGFTGRDVKAMAGLPSTPEAPGLVEFDYSALPASQASVAEKRALAAEIESNLETLVTDKIDDLRLVSDVVAQQKLQDLLDSKDYAGIGRLYPDLLQPAVNAAKRFENEYPGSMTDNALLEQSFADYYIAQTVPLSLEDKHKNMTDQGIEVPPLDTLREFDSDEAAAEELEPDTYYIVGDDIRKTDPAEDEDEGSDEGADEGVDNEGDDTDVDLTQPTDPRPTMTQLILKFKEENNMGSRERLTNAQKRTLQKQIDDWNDTYGATHNPLTGNLKRTTPRRRGDN